MPLPAIVSDTPGAASALQAVADKLREFDAKGPEILALMHQSAALKGAATAQGKPEVAERAATQLRRVQALYKVYGTVNDKLAPVRDWLTRQGFGVIVVPVIVAAAAVAAIVGMTYVISATANERQELDLLARGVLTPEQLAAIREKSAGRPLVGVNLGPVLWVAGGVAALYVFGPRILAALRRQGAAPA